jgi:hypothetical protein
MALHELARAQAAQQFKGCFGIHCTIVAPGLLGITLPGCDIIF